MKVEIKDWDSAEYLETKEDIFLYLQAVFESEERDWNVVALALADVARSKGLLEIARETDVSQERLERLLSRESTPSIATVSEALHLLGLQLSITSLSERKN